MGRQTSRSPPGCPMKTPGLRGSFVQDRCTQAPSSRLAQGLPRATQHQRWMRHDTRDQAPRTFALIGFIPASGKPRTMGAPRRPQAHGHNQRVQAGPPFHGRTPQGAEAMAPRGVVQPATREPMPFVDQCRACLAGKPDAAFPPPRDGAGSGRRQGGISFRPGLR